MAAQARAEQHLTVGEVPPDYLSGASVYMSSSARQLAALHSLELTSLSRNIVFLTGSGNVRLANDVANLLGQKLYYAINRYPADALGREEEVMGQVPVKTDRKDIVIFQSMGQAVNTELMEVLVLLDALKRMKKGEITVVLSYMGYGRAEKKDKPGRSITTKLVADLMKTAGANRVLTCDMHADAEVGFFDFPVDQLYGSQVLIPYIKELIEAQGLNFKAGAPDDGAVKRTISWSRRIADGKEDIVIFKKNRDKDNGKTKIVSCQGEIAGYDIVLTDDLYASGITLDDCATYAKANGARSVRGVVVHGLFLGDKKTGRSAIQVLDESPLDEIIVTDTIDIPEEIRKHPKVRILSIAPLLAEAVYRNIIGESLEELVE